MRKVFVFCLMAVIGAIFTPVLGQKAASGNGGAVKQPDGKTDGNGGRNTNERGSKELPLVIDTEGHKNTEAEARHAKEKEDRTRYVEDRTLLYAEISAGATAILMIAGIVGAVLANRTLGVIEKQTRATESELIVAHRAYLSLGKIRKPIGNEALLPIRNRGHVPTTIISISLEIEAPDKITTYNRWSQVLAPFQDLQPNETYRVIVPLPDEARVSSHVLVSGVIEYGIGFKPSFPPPSNALHSSAPTDFFRFSLVYSKHPDHWEIGGPVAEMRFVHTEIEEKDIERG